MLIFFLLQNNAIAIVVLDLNPSYLASGISPFDIIKKITFFFMIWVMFWNISRIYIFFISIKNIKSNCYIIFLNFFPTFLIWWKIYSFPATSICKKLTFVILCGFFFYFFIILLNFNSLLKTFVMFFIDRIYCCLFVFYPFMKIYIWSTTVCSGHVTYTFQSESTLYSCLNVKEIFARSRHETWSLSDCKWTQTHNRLVHKRTLNHSVKLAKWTVEWMDKWFGWMVECSFKN